MATRVRFFVPASMGRVLVSFSLGWVALNGYTGTIFRTREYGEVVFVLFLVCVLLSMATRVRFFVPMSVWVVGLFLRRAAVWEKTVGTKKSYPLFIKVYCLVTV